MPRTLVKEGGGMSGGWRTGPPAEEPKIAGAGRLGDMEEGGGVTGGEAPGREEDDEEGGGVSWEGGGGFPKEGRISRGKVYRLSTVGGGDGGFPP